jgi:hypothetical protein
MKKSKAVTRKKTSRTPAQPKPEHGIKQLVITLSTSSGEIAKIEQLASTGKRRIVSEAELATLAGDDDMEDFCEALEAAYAAGIRDGFEEAMKDDPFAESGATHGRQGTGESTGAQILRSGVRKTVLRSALRRGLSRRAATAGHNGAHDAR